MDWSGLIKGMEVVLEAATGTWSELMFWSGMKEVEGNAWELAAD